MVYAAYATSACFSRPLSSGKERDPGSGLDYFGARYNGSTMGRFMSPDPIGIMTQKLFDPQQWNGYAYSKNNPLRFIDPSGMYVTTCKDGDKGVRKTPLISKNPGSGT